MREVFYTYSASGIPADPDENSTKYTGALPYAVGYYKAIAKEGSEWSTVTSKSFGITPTDYIHYYPLTADFNDHAGSNNLSNSGCTIDGNGCLIDSKTDRMSLSATIGYPITINLTYYCNRNNDWNTILNSDTDNYNTLLIRNDGAIGMWNTTFYSSDYLLNVGNTYKITLTMDKATESLYVDNVLVKTFNIGFNKNLSMIGNHIYASQGALGIIKEIKIFNRVLTQDEINLL